MADETTAAAPMAYDAVRYPPIVHRQTHPDRLFANATLFGMNPAPLENCRVLELGCGDASNLLAIAFAHPGSQCVGIDTSGAAIADGREMAEEVGIENLSLLQTDVSDIGPDFGQFDYIIAHGLYSWVPPEVREKVMEICRANLAPDGVAYVSYAAYPGAHFREMFRGLMTYHVRQFDDPIEKVRQAKGLLQFLADSQPPPAQNEGQGAAGPQGSSGGGGAPTVGPNLERPNRDYALRRNELYRQLIRNELDHMQRMPPALVFHDDLADFNQPVYFHQFHAHAGRHELQYLCEAEFIETQPPVPGAPTAFAPEVAKVLNQVPAHDIVAREQYADFIKCRQFRQSLLCHASVAVARPATPQRVMKLYASSSVRPLNRNADLRTSTPEGFEVPNRGTFAVNHPMAKAALAELGEAWPRRLHFDELVERCRKRLAGGAGGDEGAPPAAPFADATNDPAVESRLVAETLLTGYATNVVALHGFAPKMTVTPGERPVASALSRAQAKRRVLVSNLSGSTVDLSGPVPTRLIRLLDGSRDRDELARDLAVACLNDGQARARNGVPITDPVEMAQILRGEMDDHLKLMAHLSLLVE